MPVLSITSAGLGQALLGQWGRPKENSAEQGPARWVDFCLCDSDRVLSSLCRPFLVGEAQLLSLPLSSLPTPQPVSSWARGCCCLIFNVRTKSWTESLSRGQDRKVFSQTRPDLQRLPMGVAGLREEWRRWDASVSVQIPRCSS